MTTHTATGPGTARSLSTAVVLGAAALALGALAGCSSSGNTPAPSSSGAGLANPASEYCVQQGGTVEIVTGSDGDQGFCNLPDGTRVDEWEYFRANNGASASSNSD